VNNPIENPLPSIDQGDVTVDCRTGVSKFERYYYDELKSVMEIDFFYLVYINDCTLFNMGAVFYFSLKSRYKH